MIGWCMILMAASCGCRSRPLPRSASSSSPATTLIDPSPGRSPNARRARLGAVLAGSVLRPGPARRDGPTLLVLYSIVPWIGVMAAGYAFGAVLRMSRIDATARVPPHRRRGDRAVPRPPRVRPVRRPAAVVGVPACSSFLNTTKYPASLSFLLMTLGPMRFCWSPSLDPRARAPRAVARRVRACAVLLLPAPHSADPPPRARRVEDSPWRGQPWLFTNHPMGNPPPPEGYVWSLSLLYLVWGIAVALLYVASRWFDRVKASRRIALAQLSLTCDDRHEHPDCQSHLQHRCVLDRGPDLPSAETAGADDPIGPASNPAPARPPPPGTDVSGTRRDVCRDAAAVCLSGGVRRSGGCDSGRRGDSRRGHQRAVSQTPRLGVQRLGFTRPRLRHLPRHDP